MAKATKKQALGRGLSALLKDPENDIKSASDKNADKVVGNIIELDLNSIEVNPFQPRTSFNDETLQELATSIREIGVRGDVARADSAVGSSWNARNHNDGTKVDNDRVDRPTNGLKEAGKSNTS